MRTSKARVRGALAKYLEKERIDMANKHMKLKVGDLARLVIERHKCIIVETLPIGRFRVRDLESGRIVIALRSELIKKAVFNSSVLGMNLLSGNGGEKKHGE